MQRTKISLNGFWMSKDWKVWAYYVTKIRKRKVLVLRVVCGNSQCYVHQGQYFPLDSKVRPLKICLGPLIQELRSLWDPSWKFTLKTLDRTCTCVHLLLFYFLVVSSKSAAFQNWLWFLQLLLKVYWSRRFWIQNLPKYIFNKHRVLHKINPFWCCTCITLLSNLF